MHSLGNHEFDNDVSGLTPFIETLTCPVLATNLNLTKVPELANQLNLMNSIIFHINGIRIGVIGYVTPDTKFIAIKNDVNYIEELIAIKKEVEKLKAQGVKILIALGHSGYAKDLEIAKEVEDIDLVVGGHSHTFLWNGTNPDVEKSKGPYPTFVKQKSGRLVPTVQAYAYTKYLGKLHLTFDSGGEIINANGIPILLDNSIPQDPTVLKMVKLYRANMMNITERVIGNTSVMLDSMSCTHRECNMGNLITDAMVEKYAKNYKGKGWSDAPAAIINGAGIRASIAHIVLPANITQGDLMLVMPFDGHLLRLTLFGSDILKMLEHAVAKYNSKSKSGLGLLQMSGIKVEYDFLKPSGLRVQKVDIRCGECQNPEFSILNVTKMYNILVTSFLAGGGDGYWMFDGAPAMDLPYNELESTIEYIGSRRSVNPSVEGRIIMNHL